MYLTDSFEEIICVLFRIWYQSPRDYSNSLQFLAKENVLTMLLVYVRIIP